jgi:hypothetical protein
LQVYRYYLPKLGEAKMKYTSILATAAVLVGLAAPALAGAPTGSYSFKSNGNGANPATNSQGSPVGVASSQITQNGQFVGGSALGGQTNYPGQRSEAVQSLLGH